MRMFDASYLIYKISFLLMKNEKKRTILLSLSKNTLSQNTFKQLI